MAFRRKPQRLIPVSTFGTLLGVKAKGRTAEKEDLEEAVTRLTEEVRILRQSIDEFREDFVHLLRNLPDNLPPPYAHLPALAESFSVDSPAREEQPERPDAHSVLAPSAEVAPKPPAAKRQTLFD